MKVDGGERNVVCVATLMVVVRGDLDDVALFRVDGNVWL